MPSACMMTGAGFGAASARAACSIWDATEGGSGAGTAAGKTNRAMGGRNGAAKRNSAGPPHRKYPGSDEAPAAAPREAISPKDTARQFQNRRCFMGLISLSFKTVIRWSIDGLRRKL